jgi:hypothetical protein
MEKDLDIFGQLTQVYEQYICTRVSWLLRIQKSLEMQVSEAFSKGNFSKILQMWKFKLTWKTSKSQFENFSSNAKLIDVLRNRASTSDINQIRQYSAKKCFQNLRGRPYNT